MKNEAYPFGFLCALALKPSRGGRNKHYKCIW